MKTSSLRLKIKSCFQKTPYGQPADESFTGVVCSLARVSFRPSRFLFSDPTNSTLRTNLMLHLSYIEGQSWSISRGLCPGLSTQSDLVALGVGELEICVIFKSDEEIFPDRISVAILSLFWLERIK